MAAKLPDIQSLIMAGIDPVTGLPIRMDPGTKGLKENFRKQMRVLDEQDAINTFTWYNLPNGLTGRLIERILYYKGQAIFFYMKQNDTFYFLPYALNGNIDVYGRFLGVTPLTFGGGSKEDKIWIKDLIYKPLYDIWSLDREESVDPDTYCVILKDYTEQLSQLVIPRQILNDPLVSVMAEAFPFARTAIIANSGIKGYRVNDEDQKINVDAASKSVTRAALEGEPWVPIVGNIEFQELTSQGTALKSQEFLLYLQSLDNYRLKLHGLDQGGLFQKKAHMLEGEQEENSGNSLLVYQDRLSNRQHFCDMVNALFGLGIWVEASEGATQNDEDMDGDLNSDADQSGNGTDLPEGVNNE